MSFASLNLWLIRQVHFNIIVILRNQVESLRQYSQNLQQNSYIKYDTTTRVIINIEQ